MQESPAVWTTHQPKRNEKWKRVPNYRHQGQGQLLSRRPLPKYSILPLSLSTFEWSRSTFSTIHPHLSPVATSIHHVPTLILMTFAPIPIILVQISAPLLLFTWPPSLSLVCCSSNAIVVFVFEQPLVSLSAFLFLPLPALLLYNLVVFAGFLGQPSIFHPSKSTLNLAHHSFALLYRYLSPHLCFSSTPYTCSAIAREGHQHGCSGPSPPHPLEPRHLQGMTSPPMLSDPDSVKGKNKTPPRPTSCRVFLGCLSSCVVLKRD